MEVIFGDDESWFYAVRTDARCKSYEIAVDHYNGNVQHTGVYWQAKRSR